MSAEQGDVEAIREALTSTYHFPLAAQGLAALDRLAAALRREAEIASGYQFEASQLRAALEKIAACNGATEKFVRYREVTDIARAALRPSEDTSDES